MAGPDRTDMASTAAPIILNFMAGFLRWIRMTKKYRRKSRPRIPKSFLVSESGVWRRRFSQRHQRPLLRRRADMPHTRRAWGHEFFRRGRAQRLPLDFRIQFRADQE